MNTTLPTPPSAVLAARPAFRRASVPLLLLAGLVALLLAAGPAVAGSKMATPGWEQVSDVDGIKLFVRSGEFSKLKAFKGVTRMRIADEYVLATVLNDYDAFPQWLYLFRSAREVGRRDPLNRALYMTTDLPWPVANRDLGVELTVRQAITPREESIVIDIHDRDDVMPPQDGYVRVKHIKATLSFVRVGKDEFDVTFEALFDPAGRLPLWLVNTIAADIPYNTLSQLRRMVNREGYPAQYIDYLELRGPTRPSHLPPARSYLYGNPPAQPLPDLQPAQVNKP